MKRILTMSIVLFLFGCDLLSSGDNKGDPATELTKSINFVGGTVVEGSPPSATNNPDDPVVGGLLCLVPDYRNIWCF